MANTILMRSSQDQYDGPTELKAANSTVGELAVNTYHGTLFLGGDPAATSSDSAGAAVEGVTAYYGSPLWTVANVDTAYGSSFNDSEVISGESDKPVFTLRNTNDDAGGASIKFDKNCVSDNASAAADVLGTVTFYGEDVGEAATEFARIQGVSNAVTSGSESGKIAMGVATTSSGAYADVLTITGGPAAATSTVAALGHLTVAGNLTVSGTTTTVDTTNLVVKDKLITLNDGGNSTSGGVVGIEIEENATPTGYVKTNANGDWTMLGATGSGSAKSGVLTLDVNASKTITVAGNLNIEGDSNINQDLSDNAAWTCAGLTSTGDLTTTGAAVDWDLIDNNASALSFDTSGKAGVLALVTTNSGEKVTMSGGCDVTGTLTAGTFAPASLAVGGGYDDTGVTISAAGVYQGNGAMTVDGDITTEGSFVIGSASIAEAELELLDGITAGTAAASKCVTTDSSNNLASLGTLGCGAITSGGNLAVTGTITGDTSLTLDSTTLTTAELGVLDGVTLGTAAASKAVTTDSSNNLGSLGTLGCGVITSTGSITSGGSFIIGSASIAEAELELLDGITAGTAAASKCLVADSSGNLASLGTLGVGAITSSAVATITKDTDAEFVALTLINQSDAANTTGSVSIRFDLEDSSGTAVDAGKILVSKEASFTSTAGTQDANMEFYVSLNGTLTEKASLSSGGTFVATLFSGSGASLTSLPAGNLSGTVNGGTF